MASLLPMACGPMRSLGRSGASRGQSLCAINYAGASSSWTATAQAFSACRRIHASSWHAKEAGPIETKLHDDQLTLAAQAARTIDVGNLKGERSAKVERLADMVCELNLIEAMQLSEALKKKLGVPANFFPGAGGGGVAPAPAAAAAPAVAAAPAAAPAPPKEEKLTVDIRLKSFKADVKIKVIKEVRAVTNLGLKEAKELVESAPCTILAKVKKEEAAKIVEKLKAETGAEMEMV